MRRHATFLGLALTIVAFSMTDTAGQEQKKADFADKQQPKKEAATQLLKTQLQAAQKVYQASVENMEVKRIGGFLVMVKGNTRARPDLVYTWSVRWLHAQRELSENKDDKIAAFVDHHKRMKTLQEQVKLMVGGGNSGLLADSEVPAAEWCLAEAELWLVQERGK